MLTVCEHICEMVKRASIRVPIGSSLLNPRSVEGECCRKPRTNLALFDPLWIFDVASLGRLGDQSMFVKKRKR